MVRLNRWILLLGGCLALILLGLAGALSPVSAWIRKVTLPLAQSMNWAAQTGTRSLEGGAKGAESDQIQELQTRLASISVEYVKLRALEEENRALRSQAKFLDRAEFDSVGARVISRDVQNERALLLINRGLNDSVEVGQAAITEDGIFIGKISAIQEQVATIELISDPKSRVAAALPGKGSLLGVVEGRGNGATVLTYVPASEGLKRDQVVVTGGTEDKVPANLPIGIVNTVEGKSTDPFLNAVIEPLVSLDRVVFVSILRPAALRPKKL